jgi:2-C-methyl-D-erythritol 4-phosphate cytidylyltransferase
MKKTSSKSVIIVAGGSGSRLPAESPKQFLLLAGRPVIMHTIQKFREFATDIKIILVLPFAYIELWNRLISQYRFTIPHQITSGGTERFHSVKNGLQLAPDEGLIAVHDGVRPLVSANVIHQSFKIAALHGGAVPVVLPSESLRRINMDKNYPVDRNQYRLVQTPQTFRASLLKKAYNKPFETHFTDDATVFEANNNKITLFEGNRENIKITWPSDLRFAEALIGTKHN